MTKISDASLVTQATGGMKIPTGEVGDLAITVEQIRQYIIDRLGLGALLGIYRIDTSGIAAPVGSGDIRYNNATQVSSTVLYISHLTDDGVDIDFILEFLATSTKLIIQDKDESDNYQRWEISATPSFSSGTWTIPVTFIEGGGTGLTGFANNHQIILSAFTAGGAAAGGHEIQEAGTPLPTQPALNFIGLEVSDNVGNSSTDVELTLPNIESKVGTATVDTVPVDGDYALSFDSGLGIILRTTWTNVKAFLKTYFDGLYVALSGNQTITGVKTFSSSPVVPTASSGTDNTEAASTAFVQQEIDYVKAISCLNQLNNY